MKTLFWSGTLAAALLTICPNIALAGHDDDNDDCKFEGTWIGKSQQDPSVTPVNFFINLVANKSDAGFQMIAGPIQRIGNLNGSFPNASQAASGLRGDVVRIGENEAAFTALAYGIEPDDEAIDANKIAYIRRETGTLTFADDCDTIDGFTFVEIFLPSQDIDNDGFPDAGQVPVGSGSGAVSLRRLRVIDPDGDNHDHHGDHDDG